MAGYRNLFRAFLLGFLGIFLLLIVVGFQILSESDDNSSDINYDYIFDPDAGGKFEEHVSPPEDGIPILLWWTHFTGNPGSTRSCGNDKCFFTVDRHFKDHKNTKVFLFYGTDIDIGQLPIPRQTHHEWALLHEESPKNVYLYSHREMMELFNHTSTFKRESDYPLTTQYLKGLSELETRQYLVPFEEKTKQQAELALVSYVQSDCNVPSDRDHFVQMLQQYIKVDSYGACEHNKDLPLHLQDPLKGMDHPDFYNLTAQYKFTLAMENGVCDDYITEKLWRPLIAGSVPIVFGSPKIRDFLPTEKSAIVINDYQKMTDLVSVLLRLNSSKEEYEEYLTHKRMGVSNKNLREVLEHRPWGYNDWTKPNFIESFECHICNKIHRNIKRESQGVPLKAHRVTVDHYGCPKPKRFRGFKNGGRGLELDRVDDDWWAQEWTQTHYQAQALKELVESHRHFTKTDVEEKASLLQYRDQGFL